MPLVYLLMIVLSFSFVLNFQNHIYLDPEQYYKNLIGIHHLYLKTGASRIAQLVKNPPAVNGTPVQFLGWEDLLKK